jgi:hypothetical protein
MNEQHNVCINIMRRMYQDGDCSMMDCYDLLSFMSCLVQFGQGYPKPSMAHSVAMKIALFSCF